MSFAKFLPVLFLGAAFEVTACASAADVDSSESAIMTGSDAERLTAERFDRLRASDRPEELESFLRSMPKGGDLHNHLSGAVYAESFIAWAKADGLCINKTTFALVAAAQCADPRNVALPNGASDPLYKAIIGAWSMADFTPSAEQSGHDHFFATFGKFGLVSGAHTGDMIAEVANRAAAENEQYLELMLGIAGRQASQVGDQVWGTGHGEVTPEAFASFYDGLLASPDWAGVLAAGTQALDNAEAKERAALGCAGDAPQPGCGVTVRYLYQISRTGTPHQIFTQFVAAFEIAMREKRIVGLNLVSPEDNKIALRDYELHMAMLDFLHAKYAGRSPLHVALHAGELTAAVLPPNAQSDLTFHIRSAVEKGHAERIGHGVDILFEDDSAGLRTELRERNVLVEICLTSNAAILEVSGPKHPLASYLTDRVPVTIATDDPGVARSNMTNEYVRAATDQGLAYVELKRMARNSVEHSFLPGDSLWTSVADAIPVQACSGAELGRAEPATECQLLLAASERARMEWELERRLASFERSKLAN